MLGIHRCVVWPLAVKIPLTDFHYHADEFVTTRQSGKTLTVVSIVFVTAPQ